MIKKSLYVGGGGGSGKGASLSALTSTEAKLRYLQGLAEVIQLMLSRTINVPCPCTRPSPA